MYRISFETHWNIFPRRNINVICVTTISFVNFLFVYHFNDKNFREKYLQWNLSNTVNFKV